MPTKYTIGRTAMKGLSEFSRKLRFHYDFGNTESREMYPFRQKS